VPAAWNSEGFIRKQLLGLDLFREAKWRDIYDLKYTKEFLKKIISCKWI